MCHSRALLLSFPRRRESRARMMGPRLRGDDSCSECIAGVIPAQAGIQSLWIPACAGMTSAANITRLNR